MSLERRLEPRSPIEGRALMVAPAVEHTCRLIDQSRSGLRIRLDRTVSLPREAFIVDLPTGIATPVQIVWQKGMEAGLKRSGEGAPLKGLVPSRLIAVRDAWQRAGGR
ncbi:PilZ domain-containing protein [Brevundimonas sp.]|uniref:PilZ domain-containing protein n=1 Tax=Brevundimonas sp. TaxID=1871086 RepID=UPI003AF97960